MSFVISINERVEDYKIGGQGNKGFLIQLGKIFNTAYFKLIHYKFSIGYMSPLAKVSRRIIYVYR